MPVDLGPIVDHAPAWLLVLFRLTGIFVIAPMIGSSTIPRQVRLFLVLGLSFCVYPMLLDPGRASMTSLVGVLDNGLAMWGLIGMIGVELLIGFVIGYVASLPLIGMQIGGQVIDQQMGLGFAGIVNPELDEEAGVIARLFFMLALTIFVIIGGYRIMFAILIASFQKIPLGGFDNFEGLVHMVVGLLDVTFDMAIQIAAPMLCVMFLVQISMGFIMRTVPQINVLSIGFVVRILLGATFLIAFIAVAAGVFVDALRMQMLVLMRFFTG